MLVARSSEALGEFDSDGFDDDDVSVAVKNFDADVDIDAEDVDPLVSAEPAKRGRPKAADRAKAAVPAEVLEAVAPLDGGVTSVYIRLVEYGLLKKITDIVMAKVSVPWHLREDAAQEIHASWAALEAKGNFARNQLGRYAYISGQHAALKLRRTIGAVVAIPGAVFRTGRDSAFMESIGAAVNPKDVEDYKDSMELSIDPEGNADNWISERFFFSRMEGLTLSAKQRNVAYKALVERKSTADISVEMQMPSIYVERLLNQVANKLEFRDKVEKLVSPVLVDAEKPAPKARAQARVDTVPAAPVAAPAKSRAAKARAASLK